MTTTAPAVLPPLPAALARLAEGVELLDPMTAPALRWGIIGAGHIARRFAEEVPAYSSSRVEAIAARDLDRARAFAQEHGAPRAYGGYRELLEDPEVDAVYIATVNPAHREQALLAVEAGKPVLVEKPFALNADEAREVFAAARERGVFAMEAMWTRFLPQFEVIRRIARNGLLGAPVNAHANFSGTMLAEVPRLVEPALGGGALLDIGVYSISAVEDVLGPPESVVAAGRLMAGHPVDASAAVIMRTAAALGTARCNLDGRAACPAEFSFEHGILELPADFFAPGTLRLYEFDGDGPTEESADGVHGARIVEWDATVPGGFQYQVASFARDLAAGRAESAVMPHSATITAMSVLDRARADIGVVYPGEVAR
ncbi:Gfo/Idh/MocA family protein [Gulosibacter sp. 10]|uniref:Gfo/Idh/MocA family protein n=1 Tax=Gulosibacter sp. 10 TaxID=1255570 RepID=UPI00097EC103|nr:Gfo/Idh/MocA family oxidoreductase [Gulosibacter sp. 10]SJM64339.1 GFO/IDH/MOCA family oxidoreductase [Gulosibacter sp. 10]